MSSPGRGSSAPGASNENPPPPSTPSHTSEKDSSRKAPPGKWRGLYLDLLILKTPGSKTKGLSSGRRATIQWTLDDKLTFRGFLAQHMHSPASLSPTQRASCDGCTDEALKRAAKAVGFDASRASQAHWFGFRDRMLTHFAYEMDRWVGNGLIEQTFDNKAMTERFVWDEAVRRNWMVAAGLKEANNEDEDGDDDDNDKRGGGFPTPPETPSPSVARQRRREQAMQQQQQQQQQQHEHPLPNASDANDQVRDTSTHNTNNDSENDSEGGWGEIRDAVWNPVRMNWPKPDRARSGRAQAERAVSSKSGRVVPPEPEQMVALEPQQAVPLGREPALSLEEQKRLQMIDLRRRIIEIMADERRGAFPRPPSGSRPLSSSSSLAKGVDREIVERERIWLWRQVQEAAENSEQPAWWRGVRMLGVMVERLEASKRRTAAPFAQTQGK